MTDEFAEIVIVGAGPAGIMAAIRAKELRKEVILLEKNNSIGKKILLTGKKRCNLTNEAPIEDFVKKFKKQGKFLKTAFYAFSNRDLINFFERQGLSMKRERQGRIFPITDKSASVVEALAKCLSDNKIKILYNTRITGIAEKEDRFYIKAEKKLSIKAKKVILATGGASYAATGSTGDGFKLARQLGHSITRLVPALVPLRVAEPWIKGLQGLTLKNVRFNILIKGKKIRSSIGEILFTHFGVSGPLILDLSGEISGIIDSHISAPLFIDMKPGLTPEKLDKRILAELKKNGKMQFCNILKSLIPSKMVSVFMMLAGISGRTPANQVTKDQRRVTSALLKAFPLTLSGALPLEYAMVTAGGVLSSEINSRTLESKIIPHLYFAGEIIEGSAPSGGFSLQQAFSTGHLAGENAAHE